ncbi:MAG: class I SAM-dependent methyltransferase [Lutibacter sp.]|jgi:SAM-dependent methyltransferase|nr:class I SAM-dependent methyltransferase [Lutibacter sp.]
MKQQDWFTTWFDSPYYHTLYQHRNATEAALFIRNLADSLEFNNKDHLLDLACGKGRHAIYLNNLGYRVTGADLSVNNIQTARKAANDRLDFMVHDMRDPLPQSYDIILNLFTSFGYFEADSTDLQVLRNIRQALAPSGRVVIDYMNCKKVVANLVAKETQVADRIDFHIQRKLAGNFIVKEIDFQAGGKTHHYVEKIKYLDLTKIKSYLHQVGLTIQYTFGDYHLNTFDEAQSDRLILVLENTVENPITVR